MEPRGINLSALRRSGTNPQPAVRSVTAPHAKEVEVEDDYVSPLARPQASVPAPGKTVMPKKPLPPRPPVAGTPTLPTKPTLTRPPAVLPARTAPLPPVPMTVKPKANAPKKRGRPAGKKSMKKRGDNGVVLNGVDFHRLNMLMVHGGMTRDHLAFLAGQATSVEPRIDVLVKAGYIDAVRHEGRKFLYLSKKGHDALAAYLGAKELTFYSSRRTRPSTHDLKIITVATALSLGEETFYKISDKEVDILNRKKATYNRTAQNDNTVLEAMKQEILARGPRTAAEEEILKRKPRAYKTSAFYKQDPQQFAPGIIVGPKPIITENQIRESNTGLNKQQSDEMKKEWEKKSKETSFLPPLELPRNPCRNLWGAEIETLMSFSKYPVRHEGDLSPLTVEETEAITKTIKTNQAWMFDYMNIRVNSRNPYLNVRGNIKVKKGSPEQYEKAESKTHRPDGVIVLPHIRGADGFVRGGSVAIEVEENMKSPAETIANMASLFEHPLYAKAIYYVPDGVGFNNIHNRLNAVEKELETSYLGSKPLREALEEFFVVVRMDEDYYLSYRSSAKGEWG